MGSYKSLLGFTFSFTPKPINNIKFLPTKAIVISEEKNDNWRCKNLDFNINDKNTYYETFIISRAFLATIANKAQLIKRKERLKKALNERKKHFKKDTLEIWKQIKWCGTFNYKISNKGNIKPLTKFEDKIIIKEKNLGHLTVKIKHANQEIATFQMELYRVVAHYFLPKEKDKHYINFKDGNRHNIDVNNLEWISQIPEYKVLIHDVFPKADEEIRFCDLPENCIIKGR
ncbi:hypothetical protein [uncultured Polaribacter sp.]|uniref:hypothetical protein n=1 Tax=uncultured Polaribacter sp. TaxID=174711 RepID=UPI00261CB9ED|nr:hypothetical protein [uncultured Polaribacter sp.]